MTKSNKESAFQKDSEAVGMVSRSQAVKLTADLDSRAQANRMLEYQQVYRKPVKSLSTSVPSPAKTIKVPVYIGGMQYYLTADEEKPEAYIREIAASADQMIRQVRTALPGIALSNATVLALINLLDEVKDKEEAFQELEAKVERSREEIAVEKQNFQHMREINWELKKEVLRLQELLDAYENGFSDPPTEPELLPLEALVFEQIEVEDGQKTNETNRITRSGRLLGSPESRHQ